MEENRGETSTTAPSKATALENNMISTTCNNRSTAATAANGFMHRGRRLFPLTSEQQQLQQHQSHHSAGDNETQNVDLNGLLDVTAMQDELMNDEESRRREASFDDYQPLGTTQPL